ncbi:MAG: alpha/beta hydrolase, partial [Bacillales bacterium]|nr:alpha/beta hydrolase [Bacillales bacterium]
MLIEKKFINLANEETIAYIQKGNGPEIILLLHGNMASSSTMLTLIEALQDRYTVIAPDLRGFGDSSYNKSFKSLKDLAFDMLLFCDYLKLNKVHVLGWSTGFGVALELAILKPSLVKSLFSLEGMSLKGYYSIKKDAFGNEIPHTLYPSYQVMNENEGMRALQDAINRNDYEFVKNMWLKLLLVVKPISNEELDLYVKETLKERCQLDINWCWVNFNISDEPNLYTQGNSTYHQITCPITLTLGENDNIVVPKMI